MKSFFKPSLITSWELPMLREIFFGAIVILFKEEMHRDFSRY